VVTQINRELRAFPNPHLVNLIFTQTLPGLAVQLEHIRAKLDLPIAPRPSPLDRVKEAIEATGDLRVANGGNLSAKAVATTFGVSLNQLAIWLGRTRQALNKTPDANSLQDELAFFERVARLRAVVPNDFFLKWLRMPNSELDNKKPLDLLAAGERQVVADLVDDMLIGAPT